MEDERLLKTVMLRMAEGAQPRGRSVKRWPDDTADWCSCTLPEAVQLALDRNQWRNITSFSGSRGPSVLKKKNLKTLLSADFLAHCNIVILSYYVGVLTGRPTAAAAANDDGSGWDKIQQYNCVSISYRHHHHLFNRICQEMKLKWQKTMNVNVLKHRKAKTIALTS